jgi:glycosyltransferase involved in cell wall biosynthesis
MISVIMSVHNGEKYLALAIESILSQTYPHFEFIIVDDASTDGTPDLLARFKALDQRLHIIRNSNCLGLTKSLNRAISLAKGDWIARQDADDISLPDRLKKQLVYMENHPEIAVVGGWCQMIDSEGVVQGVIEYPILPALIRQELFTRTTFCHGAVLIRRICLEKSGGYRELFETSQDRDLWLRLIEQYPLSNLSDIVYQYRLHPEMATRQKFDKRQAIKELILLFAHQRQTSGRDDLGLPYAGCWKQPLDWQIRTKMKSYHCYLASIELFGARKVSRSFANALFAWLLNPRNPVAWHHIQTIAAWGWKKIYQ